MMTTTALSLTRPLSIGMVACCLGTAHVRGMGRYVYELLRTARDRTDLSWTLFGQDRRHPILQPEGLAATADVFDFKGDRFRLWEQLGLPWHALRRRVDVLHCTETTLPLWQPLPTVVTVHDTLSWEERADDRWSAFYFDRVLPAALHRAAAIITISQCSRRDILQRWPALEHKIHVAPHGIAAEYFETGDGLLPAALRQSLAGAPYMVYIGGPMERKRHRWALDVLAHSGDDALKLVLCGFGGQTRDAAHAAVPRELRHRVIFASFLSDAELRALYRGADAVLYPTLYEGFGFPAVEAQASGTPVLFSSVGSLAELVGPLAQVLPTHDLQAWVAALRQVRTQPQWRRERALEARSWARHFSWQASFDKHLQVYWQASGSR